VLTTAASRINLIGVADRKRFSVLSFGSLHIVFKSISEMDLKATAGRCVSVCAELGEDGQWYATELTVWGARQGGLEGQVPPQDVPQDVPQDAPNTPRATAQHGAMRSPQASHATLSAPRGSPGKALDSPLAQLARAPARALAAVEASSAAQRARIKQAPTQSAARAPFDPHASAQDFEDIPF
jgi:nucleoid-associated protein YgaU